MEEIQNIIEEIKAIEKEIANFEANPEDYEKEFDEMLDEVHGEFMGYSASHILKEVDPTAYRCGLLDYVDNLDVTPPDEWDMELSDLLQDLDYEVDIELDYYKNLVVDLTQDLENGEDVLKDIDDALAKLEELLKIRKEYL